MITVFTPTLNRAHLLPRLYDSLCSQTCKDFEWIIVDDGSTDGTEELVNSKFKVQNSGFPIRYYKQENGGKHTAINRGVKEAKGVLFFIADSDDYLPVDSISLVINEYHKIKDKSEISAIVGLDKFLTGKSNRISNNVSSLECTLVELWNTYQMCDDMKEVFKTSILKEIPFPEIEGEKFCPEELEWLRISEKYKIHYFNKYIYIAEYQDNGLSANIVRARMQSPILTTWDYALYNEFKIPLRQKLRNSINYWRFCFCIKDKTKIQKKIKRIWYFTKPFGYLMHIKDLILAKYGKL